MQRPPSRRPSHSSHSSYAPTRPYEYGYDYDGNRDDHARSTRPRAGRPDSWYDDGQRRHGDDRFAYERLDTRARGDGERRPSSSSRALRQRQSARRPLAAVLAPIGALLLLALLGGIIFVSRAAPMIPAVVTAPTATATLNHYPLTSIRAISMLSPTEGWGVGIHALDPKGAQYETFALHYQSGVWSQVAISSPSKTPPLMQAISMDAPDDGWMVGEGTTLWHYTGGAWQASPEPQLGDPHVQGGSIYLNAVQMVSRTEGWAVGGGLIAQYHDGAWSRIDVPATYQGPSGTPFVVDLTSLSMVSADEGWAVGLTDGSGEPPNPGSAVMMHYHDGEWLRVAGPENTALTGVSMVSAEEGWAVGQQRHQDTASSPITFEQLLLHYSGGVWTKATVPMLTSPDGAVNLDQIAMSPSGTGCAEGWSSRAPVDRTSLRQIDSSLMCYSGGKWQQVTLPATMPDTVAVRILDLTALPSGEVWIAGQTVNSTTETYNPRTLLLRYSAGSWVVYAD